MQNKQTYTPEVCRRITWAVIVDTRSFFDNIKLAEDFLEHGDYMQFPASTLVEGDFMSIKHGIKIQRHNFLPEWGTPEPQYGPPIPYHPGKSGGGGYQPLVLPATPPPGMWSQPPPPKTPTQPYNWRPVNWADECHPKIAAMMETLLTRYRGRCSVSNILTASNKRFDSLPWLDAYPAGICWLNSIAICPYGSQCAFATGHMKKGEITDAQADKAAGAMQEGATALVNRRPSSPIGKRKWRGQGRGGGPPSTPSM
jgi:hypothetical protein